VVFYAAKKKLIMAHARVTAAATELVSANEWPGPNPPHEATYKLPLEAVKWLEPPLKLDAACRAKLAAFEGRDVNGIWSWFVQTSRRLSLADYSMLSGTAPTK